MYSFETSHSIFSRILRARNKLPPCFVFFVFGPFGFDWITQLFVHDKLSDGAARKGTRNALITFLDTETN